MNKSDASKKFVKWLCARFDEGVNQWLIGWREGIVRWKSFLVAETGNRNSSREGRSITSSTRITKYAFMSLTHTHTHTKHPQRLCTHTHTHVLRYVCETMPKYEFNSESNYIALECVAVGIVQICCAYSAGSAIF